MIVEESKTFLSPDELLEIIPTENLLVAEKAENEGK